MAQALVAANPDRIVWGTDWPHPNPANAPRLPITEITKPAQIDDGLLLNKLVKWVPDAATRKKVLVDNPARLDAFAGVGCDSAQPVSELTAVERARAAAETSGF